MDDRPMSSEEMIRQAREDLRVRPEGTEYPGSEEQLRDIDEMASEEPVAVEERPRPRPKPEPSPIRPSRPRRYRAERQPQALGEVPPQSRVAVIVGLALVLLGMAVAVVLAVANAAP